MRTYTCVRTHIHTGKVTGIGASTWTKKGILICNRNYKVRFHKNGVITLQNGTTLYTYTPTQQRDAGMQSGI